MLWGPRPSNLKTKKEQVSSLTNIFKDISNSLAKMKSSIENSSFADRGNSPLETSLAKLTKSTVSFNEKTLRWHDSQTHLMVKNSDPRVQAALTPKAEKIEIKEDKMVTEKKTGLGVLAGFLEEITTGSKLSVHFLQKTSGFLEEITTGMKLSVHFLSKIADGGLKDDKDDDKDDTSAEDESEDDADEKKSAKNEKKQTSFLKGMWENMKKKHKDNWLVKHWGKLLALFVLFNTKMSTLVKLWENFIKPILVWAGENPGLAIAAALTAYFAGPAFLSAIGGALVKGLGGLLTGMAGSTMIGGGMILAGIALAIKDGFEGAKLSSEWGVSKSSGVAGAVLGGTSKGLDGAMANMGKWALIGAGIGTLVTPFIGTLIGGLIGAAVGGILGWIGGERIAKLINDPGKVFSDLWEDVKTGFDNLGKDFKIYLIDPIIDAVDRMKEWVIDAATTILPDWLLKKFGMPTRPKPTDKQTEELGQGGSTAVVKKDVVGIESEMTHIENEMAGIEQKGEANYWEKPEYKKLATKLNKLREEKGKIMSGEVGPDTTTTDTDTGDGGSTDGTKISKLNAALQRTSAKSLATWRTKGTKHGGERKMEMELMSKSGKITWDNMTPKEQKRFKLTGDKMGFTGEKVMGNAPVVEKPPLSDFKVSDTGVITTPLTSLGTKKEASQRAAERTLVKYQEGKRGSERGVELALKGPSGKHLWSKMNEKEKKKFKFAAQIAGVIPKTTNIVPDSPDNNLNASVSPDDKMNTFNSIQKENLTAATQSSSPVMISSVDNSIKSAPKEQTILMEDKIHNSPVPTGVPR